MAKKTKAAEAPTPSQTNMQTAMEKRMAAEVDRWIGQLTMDFLFQSNALAAKPEQAVVAWNLLEALQAIMETRVAAWRGKLLQVVVEQGVENDKGHHKAMIEGTEVVREKRVCKLPEEKAFRDLLLKHNIPLTEVFVEKKTVEMSATAIDNLVALGKLTEEEVAALRKVTYALKVIPSETIESFLNTFREKFGAEPKKLKKGNG